MDSLGDRQDLENCMLSNIKEINDIFTDSSRDIPLGFN